mmetsp:Transcript_55235/g.83560  ORF Transcript_55235/g.83560 Transcript_55235/m.83560 type:complete len:269 (+) Transcript_55235:3-809(+)
MSQLQQLFSVDGKVALVTGGGRGIGYMMSKALVTNGCTVYISSRKYKQCEDAAKELSSLGSANCYALPPVDLSKGKQAATDLIDNLKKAGVTKLDILVNNSGIAWGETFDEYKEVGWDRVMNLNVKGLYYVTQQCYPLLKEAATKERPARVINIGSVAGIENQFMPTYAYDASKAAVHHLTKKFASAFCQDFIICNAIAPGFIPSQMSDQILQYSDKEKVEGSIPLNRVGCENDIAGITLYLCSNAANWVTGVIIPIDGGFLVKRSML